MLVLSIDSSAGTAVAVVRAAAGAPGHVLAERADRNARSHAEAIGTLVQEVLAEAGVSATEIDAVACGVGPGPFTGLRVGIAAGIAFALGAEARLIGVPSHDAIAARAVAEGAALPLRVVRDARRREWFITSYTGLDAAGMPDAAVPTTVVSQVGLDPEAVADCATADPEAGWVGRVAAARLLAGGPVRGTAPIYVRSPDVSAAVPKTVLQ